MTHWIWPFLLLILFETVADVFALRFKSQGNYFYAILSQIVYLSGNIFWLVSLVKGAGMARGGVLFSVTVAVTAVLVGYFGGEAITKEHMIGILIGVISIAFLST